MSRRTIRISLNVPSINHAIQALEYEKRRLYRLKTDFYNKVGEKCVRFLKGIYGFGGVVNVSHEVIGDTVAIHAQGYQVAFIEFGTGTPADNSQGLRFDFGAGSWSIDHAQTYQKWLASYNTKYTTKWITGHYKYDMAGKDAFMQLENNLHQIIRESADEVFGK